MPSKSKRSKKPVLALAANHRGEIFELEDFQAVGMANEALFPLTTANTIKMPYGGELMFLPDRQPIVYNLRAERFEALTENPYAPGEPIFPVAAFNSPGYVTAYISAYRENRNADYLPLFSYGAVGWADGHFRSASLLVDKEKRQDLRQMRKSEVIKGVRRMRVQMPDNRLRNHLETCALEYGCPAAKNFFLARYEAPLPTSGRCNAKCRGCLSRQENDAIPISQRRIDFTPSPHEIAAVALEHILKVPASVVSFGQGCEGDPLFAADVIEPALRLIRAQTPQGTINMNTNGSLPGVLQKLYDAGLDSIRISLNSVRDTYYHRYFRPTDYKFSDVCNSIAAALEKDKFVSLNYLNMSGFTDTPQEMDALIGFIEKYPIHMIQWRNLNFDPIRYWRQMKVSESHGMPLGMAKVLKTVRRAHPHLKFGYFNPPRERFKVK